MELSSLQGKIERHRASVPKRRCLGEFGSIHHVPPDLSLGSASRWVIWVPHRGSAPAPLTRSPQLRELKQADPTQVLKSL